MIFFVNFSITVIDQPFKFGSILVFTLMQLSNGLDGDLVVPQSREKKWTVQVFLLLIVGYPISLGYLRYLTDQTVLLINIYIFRQFWDYCQLEHLLYRNCAFNLWVQCGLEYTGHVSVSGQILSP